jgi:hypothetical protein
MSRVLLAVLLLLGAAAAQAQRPAPQAAVVPRDITVGDVFHAAVRLDLPAGTQLAAPDSLALPDDLENAGRRELRIDTLGAAPGAARRLTLAYPLTAWRPGTYELPPLALRVVGDGSDATFQVRFPSFDVRSVLPADTAGIQPQPPRDVLGRNRLWWPILLALLLLAAVIAGLWYWWRRRRPREEPTVAPVLTVLPRDAALARLRELRSGGLIERGELKPFYEQLTETLRRYAPTVDSAWSQDLTTGELAARMRRPDARRAPELLHILAGADLVKFARADATPGDALRDLDAAVAWVEHAEPGASAVGNDDRRVA